MGIYDTIAAIATAPGAASIAVVRLSGERAVDIADKVFSRSLKEVPSHTVLYGKAVDGQGKIIDECLCTVFRAPRSYTREDVVEISCHGGQRSANAILRATIAAGARLALPGEFTKRAFLNGRIDLSQAEAVMDIVGSKTDEALGVAAAQLEGRISKKINEIRNALLDLCADIQAAADFPGEDIEIISRSEIGDAIYSAKAEIEALLKSADKGKILRDGVKCAICGKPNAGKSSLLNALLGEERVIVTPVAGTTRDVVEEYVNIRGIPVCFADTAGIRETEDEVEKIGVVRSKEYLKAADFCILIFDTSRPFDSEDEEVLKLASGKKAIIVLNKSDLPKAFDKIEHPAPKVKVSALTGEGLGQLEDEICKLLLGGGVRDGIVVNNIRHVEALTRAKESLILAQKGFEEGVSEDLLYIDLSAAVSALGEITGVSVSDEVIDKIFSRFCLGK